MIKKFLTSPFVASYGSIFVLLLLCIYYSFVTYTQQNPVTPASGQEVAEAILEKHGTDASVLIVIRAIEVDGVTRAIAVDRAFADSIEKTIEAGGGKVVEVALCVTPRDAVLAMQRAAEANGKVNAIATQHASASDWRPLSKEKLAGFAQKHPGFKGVEVYKPDSYWWPTFLTKSNLVNVVNQNADVAIIAIGMTLVIITAGIDLAVGSLLALAAVITAVTLQSWGGGADASVLQMVLCGAFAIFVCGGIGAFNGAMVTYAKIPAFIVTLSWFMIARGLALIIAVRYHTVQNADGTEGTPEAVQIEAAGFGELGNGTMFGVPNPILLMIVLYIIAHLVMKHTAFGRYVYAVGGNPEAARLSGVSVTKVLIAVYAICAAMAALAGVVDASFYEGGRPKGGDLYELRVIAAVVVGGTSLAGGEGKVLGTLIGAMIIAVIQNGLNMAGVSPYERKVVFGALILLAVLLDQLKKRMMRVST